MPYTQIHWVKLEKRLLNDHRFYSLSDEAQLIYVKMLMFSAETNNKIPKNLGVLKTALRSKHDEKEMRKYLDEIKCSFHKFKEGKEFYFFIGWRTRHNWVANMETRRNSQGSAEEVLDKSKNKIRIDKIRHHFYDKYKQKVGKDYIPTYLKDYTIIKNLLLVLSDAELMCLIDKFFNTNDTFPRQGGFTIGVFKSMINKLRSEPDTKVRYE